tara:strand:- start:148 stop:771 length:624 start_codon:yes stop_codon:yes gene_type:complete
MNNLTISVVGNQILFQIINELNLFSKYKFTFISEENLFNKNDLVIFYLNKMNENYCNKIIENKIPVVIIGNTSSFEKKISGNLIEKLNVPFSALELDKKIVSLWARYKFFSSSLINLRDYIIDKNERKIKRDNLELKLTEKEVNFLVLFSKSKKPLTRKVVLENVWNYSSKSETHTVETHIHRLRKKIFNKFKDNNFIKNNKEGYYI